jgi:hypothetical protein
VLRYWWRRAVGLFILRPPPPGIACLVHLPDPPSHRLNEEIRTLRELVAIRTETLGADHPSTIDAKKVLAAKVRHSRELSDAFDRSFDELVDARNAALDAKPELRIARAIRSRRHTSAAAGAMKLGQQKVLSGETRAQKLARTLEQFRDPYEIE